MDLKNKTVLFLGSSVTYGAASNGVSFADIMAKNCGINMIKEAVSGTTLADINDRSYVARLKTVDTSKKIDLFICQLSTNDASQNIAIDKIEDAIRFIVSYVKDVFNCPIMFYTGTYFESKLYIDMICLLEKLKDEYGFYILNLFSDPEMLSVSKTDYETYMADPIHPTLKGYTDWWTPKFIDFCKSI